jgi:hypothetical protein
VKRSIFGLLKYGIPTSSKRWRRKRRSRSRRMSRRMRNEERIAKRVHIEEDIEFYY